MIQEFCIKLLVKRTGKSLIGFDAGGESRTPDPRITNALLYQLSYAGPDLRTLTVSSLTGPQLGFLPRAHPDRNATGIPIKTPGSPN